MVSLAILKDAYNLVMRAEWLVKVVRFFMSNLIKLIINRNQFYKTHAIKINFPYRRTKHNQFYTKSSSQTQSNFRPQQRQD